MAKVKKRKIIKRIGPDKGGYWEVMADLKYILRWSRLRILNYVMLILCFSLIMLESYAIITKRGPMSGDSEFMRDAKQLILQIPPNDKITVLIDKSPPLRNFRRLENCNYSVLHVAKPETKVSVPLLKSAELILLIYFIGTANSFAGSAKLNSYQNPH